MENHVRSVFAMDRIFISTISSWLVEKMKTYLFGPKRVVQPHDAILMRMRDFPSGNSPLWGALNFGLFVTEKQASPPCHHRESADGGDGSELGDAGQGKHIQTS